MLKLSLLRYWDNFYLHVFFRRPGSCILVLSTIFMTFFVHLHILALIWLFLFNTASSTTTPQICCVGGYWDWTQGIFATFALAVRRFVHCVRSYKGLPPNRGLRRCWAPAHSTCRTGPWLLTIFSFPLFVHRVDAKHHGILPPDSRLDLIHDLTAWNLLLFALCSVHVRWTREKVRGAKVHKAGSKIPTLLTVPLVYKL